MIKQILSKLFSQKPKDIECAIDENIVDCKEMDKEPPYTGVPAPVVLSNDSWFGDVSYKSQKQEDYMEQEHEAFKEEARKHYGIIEAENIHQLMYEMATKSGATTVQLDPIGGSENFQGGSENIHER